MGYDIMRDRDIADRVLNLVAHRRWDEAITLARCVRTPGYAKKLEDAIVNEEGEWCAHIAVHRKNNLQSY